MKHWIKQFSLVFALSLLVAFGWTVPAWAQTTVPLTATGDWTAPAGVTTVIVECWGAGGGGGAGNGNNNGGGGGGGGGEYCIDNAVAVTPDSIYTVTVGTGGAGGNNGDGGAGGNSSFPGDAETPLATGGAGGQQSKNGGALGGKGTGGTGDTCYDGGDGGAGEGGAGGAGAGGGGGAGDANAGTVGEDGGTGGAGVAGAGGAGGAADGGVGGAGGADSANGNPGTTLGGGGGGGGDKNGPSELGGNGARGECRITYTPAGPTISGDLYSGEGVSPITSQPTVAIRVDGGTAYTDTAAADGSYSVVVTETVSAGDIISIYVDGVSIDANTIISAAGNSDISNADLYQNRIIIRHEDAGPVSNIDLENWDNADDDDMLFNVTVANTLTAEGGSEIFIVSTDTYTPGEVVNAHAIDINGVFTMAANAITATGSFDATGGSFTTSGTVTLSGTLDQEVTSNTSSFTNLVINNTGGAADDDVILQDNLDVNGTLRIADGQLDANTNDVVITVGSHWIVNSAGAMDMGVSTVEFDSSTADQNITSNSQSFGHMRINNTNGTAADDDIVLQDALTLTGSLTIADGEFQMGANNVTLAGNWLTDATGAFSATTSTVEFNSSTADQEITSNGSSFSHLRIFNTNATATDDDIILQDALISTGSITITDGELQMGTNNVTLAGNWFTEPTGSFSATTSTVELNSTSADQTVTSNGSSFSHMRINNTNGTASDDDIVLADAMILTGSLTIADGEFQMGTNNVTLAGNWLTDATGAFDAGTATVEFNSTSADQTITSNSQSFSHIRVYNTNGTASDDDIVLQDAMILTGSLTIADGEFQMGANNVTLAGNWLTDATGAFSASTSTVEFNSSSADQTITSNSQSFSHIRINNTNGTAADDDIVLQDALVLTGSLTLADGELQVGTNNITLAGNWVADATGAFTPSTATVTFNGASGTSTVTMGSDSFYNFVVDDADGGADYTVNLGGTLDVVGSLSLTDGTLDVTASNHPIFIDGNWVKGASGTFTPRSGTVDFNSTTNAIVISGATSFSHLAFNGTSANDISVSDDLVVSGSVTIANVVGSDILAHNAETHSITVSGNVNKTGAGNIETDLTIIKSGGGIQTISSAGGNLGNLQVTAATQEALFLTNAAFDGNITIDSGATLDLDSFDLTTNAGATITVSGTLQLDGDQTLALDSAPTLNAGSIVEYTATAGTSTLQNWTYDNLRINGSGGTFDLGADLTVNGTLQVLAGAFDPAGYDVTVSGSVDIDDALDLSSGAGGNATLSVGRGWDVTGGTFTSTNSTVIFTGDSGTATYDIFTDNQAFYNITFNEGATSTTWILEDALDVNGTLMLTSGTLDIHSSEINAVSVAGNWVETSGTFVPRTGTVTLDGLSGTQTISADTSFYNFMIDDPNGGSDLTIRPAGTLDIDGTFRQKDSTFDLFTNNINLYIARNFILEGGTFTPPVSTITWDGLKTFTDNTMTNIGTILITPDTTMATDMVCTNLTIAAGDTLTTDGFEIDCSKSITVEGTLDARPGTDGTTTVNVAQDWDSGTGLLFMASSTVIFDDIAGTNTVTVGSNSFYNVTFQDANGGSNTTWNLGGDLDVHGTLQILVGELDATTSNYDIFVAGNWINQDDFTPRSATVTFDGTSGQTITTCDGCSTGNFSFINVTNTTGTVAFLDSFSVVNLTATFANTNLNFEQSTTVTITSNLTLDGQGAGTRIFLDSSDFTNRFTFDVTGGAQTVDYVDVSNSQASTNDITATNSNDRFNTDSGDSPATAQWVFPGGGPLKGAVIIVD